MVDSLSRAAGSEKKEHSQWEDLGVHLGGSSYDS